MSVMKLDVRSALLLVLDHVDYMHRACLLTEAVGAVLPAEVIAIARASIADHDARTAHDQD